MPNLKPQTRICSQPFSAALSAIWLRRPALGRVSPAQGKWGVLVRDSQRLQNLFMKGVSRLCFADQGSTRFHRISGAGFGGWVWRCGRFPVTAPNSGARRPPESQTQNLTPESSKSSPPPPTAAAKPSNSLLHQARPSKHAEEEGRAPGNSGRFLHISNLSLLLKWGLLQNALHVTVCFRSFGLVSGKLTLSSLQC